MASSGGRAAREASLLGMVLLKEERRLKDKWWHRRRKGKMEWGSGKTTRQEDKVVWRQRWVGLLDTSHVRRGKLMCSDAWNTSEAAGFLAISQR